MTFYVFSYDTVSGLGLSVNTISDVDDGIDLAAYSSEGNYAITELPEDFAIGDYRADLLSLDANDLPMYIIERYTGYAYGHDGTRVPSADIEAEVREEPFDLQAYIATRGIALGDDVSNVQEELDEDEREAYAAEVADRLTGIGTGRHVLVNIGFSASKNTAWPQDISTGKYVEVVEDVSITPSTVLCVIGVNRNAVLSDIQWETQEGRIVFTTDTKPISDILINGVLFETGDEWSAKGIIEAWPQQMKTMRFVQSAQNVSGLNWPLTLSARGSADASKLIATTADFTHANLLFATAERTGDTNVVVPYIYVDSSTESHVLVYRLTNISDEQVTVSEVVLNLCYTGTIYGVTSA